MSHKSNVKDMQLMLERQQRELDKLKRDLKKESLINHRGDRERERNGKRGE